MSKTKDKLTMNAVIYSVIAIFCFLGRDTSAFIAKSSSPLTQRQQLYPLAFPLTPTSNLKTPSRLAELHAEYSTDVAGSFLPAFEKLGGLCNRHKCVEIVKNVKATTEWQEILVLVLMAVAKSPFKVKEKETGKNRLFRLSRFINRFAKISLWTYLVETFCVVAATLGFTFVSKWKFFSSFHKIAYTTFAAEEIMKYKKKLLCKINKLREDDMGRFGVVNKLLNGIIVTIVFLVIKDWLDLETGSALSGIFALSGAGTAALALASKDFFAQVVAGLSVSISEKVSQNEIVEYGDGTTGKVLNIGWVNTRIRRKDDMEVLIPNSALANQKVVNISRMKTSGIELDRKFKFSNEEAIPAMLDTIKDEIKSSCPHLITDDSSRPFQVFCTDIQPDTVNVMVNTHHNIRPKSSEYWENRQNILFAINRAVKKHTAKNNNDD